MPAVEDEDEDEEVEEAEAEDDPADEAPAEETVVYSCWYRSAEAKGRAKTERVAKVHRVRGRGRGSR